MLWIKNLIHYVAWSHFPIFTRPQSCKWLSFQPYSLSWQEQWFLSTSDDNQQEINVLVLYELIADRMTTKKTLNKNWLSFILTCESLVRGFFRGLGCIILPASLFLGEPKGWHFHVFYLLFGVILHSCLLDLNLSLKPDPSVNSCDHVTLLNEINIMKGTFHLDLIQKDLYYGKDRVSLPSRKLQLFSFRILEPTPPCQRVLWLLCERLSVQF